MILRIDDWEFDVDITRTMVYSAAEAAEHCDCAYCRNFYAAVDVRYPHLRTFLAQFGVDIEAPDELMPFTVTHMLARYAVSGRILQCGKAPILQDGVHIVPESMETSMLNTECPTPAFVLGIGPFNIPWVLDEPLVEEDIVSPANEPSFLQKMRSMFLNGFKKDDIQS